MYACAHMHARSKRHIHFILVLDLFPSSCLSSNAAYNISVHSPGVQMEAFTKQERQTLYKGANSDCFRICNPCHLCLTYSAVILWGKRSLWQHEMRDMAVWQDKLRQYRFDERYRRYYVCCVRNRKCLHQFPICNLLDSSKFTGSVSFIGRNLPCSTD